ncbi:MAG: response regulator [Campylobacteraceae bacterium]|nr:response regulator [Campylobacteraceae bacterium]
MENFNILIVDDDEVIRTILTVVLRKFFNQEYPFLNLNISLAQNGKEAFEIQEKNAQDIILSDITMPIMDGFEFTRRVRLSNKTVPILVLSKLDEEADIDKIMQSGATNYTSKPLNKRLFLAQIRIFIDFYIYRQNRYNRKAINLFTKSVFRRKTEFLVEKEDDLFEFWEFIIENIADKYNTENALEFIYDIEILMIKEGSSNNIILEEDYNNLYLTILNIDSLEEKIVLNMLKKVDINEETYRNNGFLFSLIISKEKAEQITESLTIHSEKKIQIKEKKEVVHDMRYTIHEKITPEEFLSELDPTYEDKIESFLDDLSILSTDIFNLKDASLEDSKNHVNNIVFYLENFNAIVINMGIFNVISRSFGNLINFIRDIDDEILTDTQKRVLLSEMLQGLSNDLESWITMLFIERTADDIHYFDASFAENCFALESTFMQVEEGGEDNEEEDDLEFF